MSRFYTPGLVKRSLAAHSWIGLLVGSLMYLICLSGTLAVFYQEFERWEQPGVEEYRDYDPGLVQKAYEAFATTNLQDTEHIHIVLPLPGVPRVVVENDHEAWFVNQDGTIGQREMPLWTKMLVDLHLYLHLPQTLGLVLVSATGALLCGLILSGFLAHPRIVRDAFRLRMGGNRQLQQTDIHNRLSVWGAPFHLIIAVTGAYFGLASLIVIVVALTFHGGDEEAVIAQVFGAEPELSQEAQLANVGKALDDLETIAPATAPIFLTVHEPRTSAQFVEIYAEHPGRLIYSENYRFDAGGNYLGHAGFSDGPLGKQAIYSTYRLHFGHFGGFWVKALYFVLGMSLTVVSATGVNVWLAKRKKRDYVNDLWTGCVWGVPFALALSAAAQIVFGIASTAMFWLALLGTAALALYLRDQSNSRTALQRLTAALIALLLVGYTIRFGRDAVGPAALGINGILLLVAVGFFMTCRRTCSIS